MPIVLGKDIVITGVSNARSFSVTGTATEVDVTKFGDSSKKFKKALTDITVEVECVDSPGVAAGGLFTLAGTSFGSHQFVCTGVTYEAPIDGIQTATVSGSRTGSTPS